MVKGKKMQTRLISIFSIFLIILSLIVPGMGMAEGDSGDKVIHTSSVDAKVSDRLMEQFDTDKEVSFMLKFKQKADTKKAVQHAGKTAGQEDKSAYEIEMLQRSAVISELKLTAEESQLDVQGYLDKLVEKGDVDNFHPYFIVNGISVTATEDVMKELAAFPEVEKILPDETRELYTPDSADGSDEQAATAENSKAEWNIDRVNAPKVWEKGVTGKGAVVASIDTGVQWDHPALKEKYRGYDAGDESVDHDFNWFDATQDKEEPYDDHGHGTHVTGTMVGSESDGSHQIGVAPDAKWIAVKAFTADDTGSDSDLLKAAEWILAPSDEEGNTRVDMAPDVVNNSWGGGPGKDEWYRDVVEHWRDASIFPMFAAGNVTKDNPGGEGSVAAPANYPESFAVGATDIGDELASFSLLGPSPYDEIKPDVVAPGQTINSSIPGDDYLENSGTSMAAPAVSGITALLRSIDSDITVDRMEEILKTTAEEKTDAEYPEAPNNGYGYGIVDALNAVSSVESGVGMLEGMVVEQTSDQDPLQAKVSLVDRGRSVQSDSTDGTYALPYAGGEYTVLAESYGYHSEKRLVTLKDDETVTEDFELEEKEESEINGTVIDANTGDAIPDATLLLMEDANVEPVKTDEEGHFTFTAYEGTYTLKVTAKDYYSDEEEITITADDSQLDIELDRFHGYPGDELKYDDGSSEGAGKFLESGNAWAVRMSLDEDEPQAMVTGGKFLFSSHRADETGDEFQVEVLAADGENGEPGTKLAGPIDAKAVKDGEWTNVDLKDEGIVVEDDFYMVYIQTLGRDDAPSLEHDQSQPFTERSWEMYKGYWYQLEKSLLTGNKMIRALVDYEVEAPVITSPLNGTVVSAEDKIVTVEGNASPTTTVELVNNDEAVVSEEIGDDGEFSMDVDLEVGENTIVAEASQDGESVGKSEEVTVTREAPAPTIDSVKPEVDQHPAPGDPVDVSFVSDTWGADASFQVSFPTQANAQNEKDNDMEETYPGVYEGKWIVPEGIDADGLTIEVSITDADDKTSTKEAAGKLFITGENIDRIAGDIRYDTAVETSKEGWDSADTVILSRGEEYADALAGAPLAYKLDAPILLTPTDELWENTKDEIERLGASKAVILGGPDAISDAVSGELEDDGLEVERIAGKDRFQTAEKIASKVAPDGTEQVAVANGMDFPDALSVAAHAAKAGMPILLSKSDWMADTTAEAIADLGATKSIAVGGKEVLTDDLLADLPEANRIAGHDRYDTNIAVNEHFGVNSDYMYVATGQEYADALTGAVLAAKEESTVLLVHKRVPEIVSDYIEEQEVKRLSVFGGNQAVSDDVFDALKELLP